MGYKLACLLLLSSIVFGANEDCGQYFEAKKAQMELQTREFDEARQSLEAYKASFEALQKEKLENLVKKEAELNATLAKVEQLKLENIRLLEEQQKILSSIEDKTQGRVREIYSQMKDSAIADVLSHMDAKDASKIMLSLSARKISGVLSKMEPKKASELTLLLKNLDKNATSISD